MVGSEPSLFHAWLIRSTNWHVIVCQNSSLSWQQVAITLRRTMNPTIDEWGYEDANTDQTAKRFHKYMTSSFRDEWLPPHNEICIQAHTTIRNHCAWLSVKAGLSVHQYLSSYPFVRIIFNNSCLGVPIHYDINFHSEKSLTFKNNWKIHCQKCDTFSLLCIYIITQILICGLNG